jgi:hypothetical protein
MAAATSLVSAPTAIAAHRMHRLGLWGTRAPRPEDVVHDLLAVQAQEWRYARWSVAQRTRRPGASNVDRAFDEGKILRTHILRPTWHYVTPDDLAWLVPLSGPKVHARNTRRYRELQLDPRTLARSADLLADAAHAAAMTRHELAGVLEAAGVATTGQRLSHLLMHAELHGAICSGPMRGKEMTYAAFDDRVPRSGLTGEQALAEVARRYFATRGPATTKDFGWWSGFAAAEVAAAVDAVRGEFESTTVDGRTYWWSGSSAMKPSRPKVDLVQCYDEVIISYTESRDALVGDVTFRVPRSIDGFTHVVLLDGQLLGHWRIARGAVETRLNRKLTSDAAEALTRAIDQYLGFLAA